MSKLLKEIREAERYAERLLINSEERAFFLQVDRINWIEAAKNYVNIHTGNEAYLLRGTIDGLHKRLDPKKFIRVNRSQIVVVVQFELN